MKMSSLSPVLALRRAKVFVSCLPAPEAREAVKNFGRKLPTMNLKSSAGEPEVVMLEDIVPYMKRWIAFHDTGTKSMKVSERQAMRQPMSGLALLVQESGVHERKIRGYLNDDFNFMSLSHADKILQAMGVPFMLGSDEIPIVRNPRWSRTQFRRYMEEALRDD